MGNTSKKLAARCTLLDKHEQKYLANTFRSASKNSDKIREEDLIRYWGPQIDPRLAQFLSNFLFGFGSKKSQYCDFQRFAELYVFNVRGSPDERLKTIYNSLGKDYDMAAELPYQLLRELCEALASTYIKILKGSSSKNAEMWIEKGFKGRASHVQALGEAIAATVSGESDTPTDSCTSDQLYRWVSTNALLKQIAETVFVDLYGVERRASDSMPSILGPSLMPLPEGMDALPDYPAFIDLSHIVWLNSQLPPQHQHKWRFLFSSHIHGESFSTMAGRIQDEGPNVLIIQDNAGYIFGGYAPSPWMLKANFYGTDESFLFTLAPKMRIYPATSYNDHYQYMNRDTKTLPNGLLMGGQFNFGGIWVNADPFGEGSSAESCSTYRNYKRLSKEPTFRIRSLDVWGVGDKPLTLKASDERDLSVLDANPEAKAILDMAGRTRHSEGIREPPPL